MQRGRNRENRPKAEIAVEASSGNVFEDLGLAQGAERLAKAEVAARIAAILKKRGLTQIQAAKLLGIDQPSVSDLLRGRLRGFSSDRLFRFLNALGRDVEIVIRRRRGTKARVRVLDEYPRHIAGGRVGKR